MHGVQVTKLASTPAAALPPPTAAPVPPGAAPGVKGKTSTPASLYLDDQGREVDEHGRLIVRNDTRVAAPTLKVWILWNVVLLSWFAHHAMRFGLHSDAVLATPHLHAAVSLPRLTSAMCVCS